MLQNVTSARYVSATKRFAVFFNGDPATAVRLPLSMYAVASAVDAAGGFEDAVRAVLQNRHGVSVDKAQELIDASVRVGVVRRGGPA